jgi:hypothetical protein
MAELGWSGRGKPPGKGGRKGRHPDTEDTFMKRKLQEMQDDFIVKTVEKRIENGEEKELKKKIQKVEGELEKNKPKN